MLAILKRCWRWLFPVRVAGPPLPNGSLPYAAPMKEHDDGICKTGSHGTAERHAEPKAGEIEKAEPEEKKEASPLSRATRRANESQYRKLLKARKKFDKFVTPQGPEPIKHERHPLADRAPPAPVTDVILDDRPLIADHYDLDPGKPVVLFEESEFYGQFNFRDTILDQLDRYWFYLDRMRRHDKEAYGFYRQVGMQLLPYVSTETYGKRPGGPRPLTPEELAKYKAEIFLPPMFNKHRPTFGCIAFGANPKTESWEADGKCFHPRFLYYNKYTRPPPEVQIMLGGDIYAMTVWWDALDKRKWGTPQQYAVFIDPTGQHIQVLKTCETQMLPIREKHSLKTFRIPDRHWRIPHDYENWAKSHGLDAQTLLCHLFARTLQQQEHAHFGDLRVQVHKDDLTAIFNIDSRRLSYFFQDRDIELTKDGRRKRIFHVVRPQVRKDGTAVKMHYRGEREFTWAGYHVSITVPGLDHFLHEELNVGMHDSYWLDKDEESVSQTQFGAQVVDWMKEGIGAHR